MTRALPDTFDQSDFLPEQQQPDSGTHDEFTDLNCGRNSHGLCIYALDEYCYNRCPLNFAGGPG